MDPAQTDGRISRVENALQQVMAATRAATAQGQQDLAQVRLELAKVRAGVTAPPPAPAATETPAPLPREPNVGARTLRWRPYHLQRLPVQLLNNLLLSAAHLRLRRCPVDLHYK